MKTKVAVFAEECLEGVETFATKAEAEAYLAGWQAGGYAYGAGSAYGVVLTPDWEKEALDEGVISEEDIEQIRNYLSTNK